MGIDATSIKLNLPFSSYGFYPLTNTIEKGIKIHLAAMILMSLTIYLRVQECL